MADRVWQLHNLDNIGFAIRFARGDGFPEGWADFEVYEIAGWPHEKKPGGPERYYQRRDSSFSPDFVERIEDAELLADGFVKWDGCLEFGFGPWSAEGRHHMCGRRDGEKFGKMMVAIWDLAAKFLERWDHECAGTVK